MGTWQRYAAMTFPDWFGQDARPQLKCRWTWPLWEPLLFQSCCATQCRVCSTPRPWRPIGKRLLAFSPPSPCHNGNDQMPKWEEDGRGCRVGSSKGGMCEDWRRMLMLAWSWLHSTLKVHLTVPLISASSGPTQPGFNEVAA